MLQVQDLHAVTPASFLEASGAVIHSLSYQQARNSRMAVGQVYLAESGHLMGQAGQLLTRCPVLRAWQIIWLSKLLLYVLDSSCIRLAYSMR